MNKKTFRYIFYRVITAATIAFIFNIYNKIAFHITFLSYNIQLPQIPSIILSIFIYLIISLLLLLYIGFLLSKTYDYQIKTTIWNAVKGGELKKYISDYTDEITTIIDDIIGKKNDKFTGAFFICMLLIAPFINSNPIINNYWGFYQEYKQERYSPGERIEYEVFAKLRYYILSKEEISSFEIPNTYEKQKFIFKETGILDGYKSSTEQKYSILYYFKALILKYLETTINFSIFFFPPFALLIYRKNRSKSPVRNFTMTGEVCLKNFTPELSDSKFIFELEHLYGLNISKKEEYEDPRSNNYYTSIDGKITELHLTNNSFHDITPLKNLIHLKVLNLSWNKIFDIKALENLKQLEVLNLSKNNIVDIRPIQNLRKLRILNLSENKLHDVNPVSNLLELTHLDFSKNRISNIQPFENITNAQIINLSENKISNILHIKNLSKLHSLFLNKNRISDISVIENLHEIKELDLSFNMIENITPLASLLNIMKMNIKNNIINNVEIIKHLEKLTHLDAEENLIEKLPSQFNLKLLVKLNISKNKVTEISAIKDAINLEILALSHNNISDLKPLSTLKKLNELNIYGNPIHDISPIENLPKLKSITIPENFLFSEIPVKLVSKLKKNQFTYKVNYVHERNQN